MPWAAPVMKTTFPTSLPAPEPPFSLVSISPGFPTVNHVTCESVPCIYQKAKVQWPQWPQSSKFHRYAVSLSCATSARRSGTLSETDNLWKHIHNLHRAFPIYNLSKCLSVIPAILYLLEWIYPEIINTRNRVTCLHYLRFIQRSILFSMVSVHYRKPDRARWWNQCVIKF